MRITIIGSGRLGSKLASMFAKRGDSILVVEQNESKFIYIEDKQGIEFLTGNAADEDIIREALKKPVDIVIVATGNDHTNILIAQKIKLIDKTVRIITRLFDINLATVYTELGIEILCPTSLTIDALMKMPGIA